MKARKKNHVGAGLRRATWLIGALALGACSGDYSGQELTGDVTEEGATFAEAEEGPAVGGDDALAEGTQERLADGTDQDVVVDSDGQGDLGANEEEIALAEDEELAGVDYEELEVAGSEGTIYKAPCGTYQMGGSTSCKTRATWVGYARERCAARKQRLVAYTFLNQCGVGTYRYIRYRCCS